MNSGIYFIYLPISQMYYVGSTHDLKRRKYTHNRLLELNKHFNKHLQNDFNKFGNGNLVFYVIEETDKNHLYLIKQELYWIIKLNNVYNDPIVTKRLETEIYNLERGISKVKLDPFYWSHIFDNWLSQNFMFDESNSLLCSDVYFNYKNWCELNELEVYKNKTQLVRCIYKLYGSRIKLDNSFIIGLTYNK